VARLPALIQAAAVLLPFRYMLGFPVEVLMGGLAPGELALGFALQTAWLLAALSIYQLVWRRGLRRYSAVGG
jgi:ABC-2 type transport system permease protein